MEHQKTLQLALACLAAGAVTLVAQYILARWSVRLSLVDRPDERKRHQGVIPVVGGLAIFAGMFAAALWLGNFPPLIVTILAASSVLVLLGALDDHHDIRAHVRLVVQSAVVLVIIGITGVHIHSLGNLFGHEFALGWWGLPLTVCAVIGLVNAFNMIDGIDGLAGSMALVSIASILLFGNDIQLANTTALLLLGAALLPFLAANFGIIGGRVFLGDAGSTLLGFLLAWKLIDLSQNPPVHLLPPDVLWCVTLPVLDALAVIYRRLSQGISPFIPDRGHIHHLFLNAGLDQHRTLACLITLAAALGFFGAVISLFGPEASLLAFVATSIVYTATTRHIYLRQEQRRTNMEQAAANDESRLGETESTYAHRLQQK